MAEPWIRVHANLLEKPVVDRCATECKTNRAQAAGHLVGLWGRLSQLGTGGSIAGISDSLIETWAGWTGRRGVFAAWVRQHHTDAEGRVNEWDSYNGVLDIRREKDRQRQRDWRDRHKASHNGNGVTSRIPNADVTRDITSDVTVTSPLANGVTIRNDTKRITTRSKTVRARGAPLPPDAAILGAHWRLRVGAVSDLIAWRLLGVFAFAHGVDAVKLAIDVYASDDEGPGVGKPRKLAWFAEEYMRWHGIAQTPLQVNGELTARGKRLAGGT